MREQIEAPGPEPVPIPEWRLQARRPRRLMWRFERREGDRAVLSGGSFS